MLNQTVDPALFSSFSRIRTRLKGKKVAAKQQEIKPCLNVEVRRKR